MPISEAVWKKTRYNQLDWLECLLILNKLEMPLIPDLQHEYMVIQIHFESAGTINARLQLFKCGAPVSGISSNT